MMKNPYQSKQNLENQEKLLKYMEAIIIMVQQHIDDGKTLDDFLEETKTMYWSIKETLVETARIDLGLQN